MSHGRRSFETIGTLLMLLMLVVAGSHAQGLEPYREAPSLLPPAGTPEYEFFGYVESMPSGGFIGTWAISGTSFEATASTEFGEEHGPLQVGARVRVRYHTSNGANYATRIETAVGGGTSTPTCTPHPTGTPTPEPTHTHTPHPTETHTPEPTHTRTPHPTETHTPEPTHTRTPHPTETHTPGPTGTPEHKLHGFVKSMPASGFIGTWVVGGISLEATASTEFREEHGPLQVGAYVMVHYYTSGGVNYATEIGTKDYYVRDQVVTRLQPGVSIGDIHRDYHTWTVRFLLERVYLLGLSPGSDVLDTVAQMQNDPRIVYAEPNLLGQVPEADPYDMWAWAGYDPAPSLTQYANEHLDLPLARELSTGSGVVVAVLDTGVQPDHPALAPHLVAGYDFVDDDTVPADEGNGLDDDGDGLVDEATGHGTHVAGIVLLVAPQSQIMPLRVLNSDGIGDVFRVAQAMIYATEHGAQVLNLSLGTALHSDVLLEGVNYARAAGVMVVAAAGNLNSTEPQYPAADEGVIAMAALDEQRLKTSFSNYGSWVDLAAPGESIYSTLPVSGYGWWSGTSMATPFVSGQIALLRSLAPWLTLDQIEGQLAAKAWSVEPLNPDYAGQLGAGEPDVAASLGCHWADVEPDATHDVLNNTCDDDVDIADVQAVAAQWGRPQPPSSVYDNDHDGDVDIVDIQRVASRWGWTRQR